MNLAFIGTKLNKFPSHKKGLFVYMSFSKSTIYHLNRCLCPNTCKYTYFLKIVYSIFVFCNLPHLFVHGFMFPIPCIFWNIHDSSTFWKNIKAPSKSWSAMLASRRTPTLKKKSSRWPGWPRWKVCVLVG
jgi:hypothetical protein